MPDTLLTREIEARIERDRSRLEAWSKFEAHGFFANAPAGAKYISWTVLMSNGTYRKYVSWKMSDGTWRTDYPGTLQTRTQSVSWQQLLTHAQQHEGLVEKIVCLTPEGRDTYRFVPEEEPKKE